MGAICPVTHATEELLSVWATPFLFTLLPWAKGGRQLPWLPLAQSPVGKTNGTNRVGPSRRYQTHLSAAPGAPTAHCGVSGGSCCRVGALDVKSRDLDLSPLPAHYPVISLLWASVSSPAI